MSNKAIKVVGICGSLRSNSHTKKALKIALNGAETIGATTQLIDLTTYNLAFCNGDSASYPDDVRRLGKDIASAQGIILGTPEYHGSFSGVLKNALDLLMSSEFEGKMVGLIGVSGGNMGALSALSSLRDIGRSLHAWVIPEQVAIPLAGQVFNKDGQIINEKIDKRLFSLGQQVARFAFLHSSQTVSN